MREVTLADGGRVAFEMLGRAQNDAPALLLCRPLGGSMVSWDVFAKCLSERARVIAFDARGTGQSSAAPLSTTTRTMARDALVVLDTLGIARAHVYGISLGGMVASWLAIDSPARVGRLVLASTMARGMHLHNASRRFLALARCFGKPATETEACLATRILSEAFRCEHPGEVARMRVLAMQHPASHRSLALLIAVAARHDARKRVQHISAPTLVLAGDRDELIGQGVQQDLANRIDGARFEVIHAGHDLSAEAPEVVAARVLAHVTSC